MEWNVADMLEGLADAYPDREALVIDGGPRLSYGELDARSTRLANHLLSLGLEPGAHIGCYMVNGNEYLETMIGCFKAKMVPINVNWRYKPDEIVYLFDDADIVATVIDHEWMEVLEEARPKLDKLDHVLLTGDEYDAALEAAGDERPFVGERSADDRYFLYTGGTTGYPKGVEWCQRDIIGAVWRSTAGLDMDGSPDQVVKLAESYRTRYFGIPPYMHGAAHWGAFSTWLEGGTVFGRRGSHFAASDALRFASEEKINMMLVIGDAFAGPIVRELDAADERGESYDISTLKILISSGAPLAVAYKEALQARIPQIIIADTLGSSEAGTQAIAPWRPGARATRFIANDVTTVLDEETLQPLERGCGEVGMLAKSGFLPVGYYKDPEKTARTFPTAAGKRWVLTGDHALIESDGTITLLGRGSNCINTGGEKVYPEEVEDALKAHPQIDDALVVAVPDDRFGSAVTAVVEISGGSLELGEVRSFCEGSIAGYKAPRHLVVVDGVPRAPSGKPDYATARALALESLGIEVG